MNIQDNYNGDMPIVIATVGGAGTRMYPLTLSMPKPLVPICNYPILRRLFEILATQGCREFIFASSGVENTLRLNEYFKWGTEFSTRLELEPWALFRYQPNYKDKGSADAARVCMEYFNINKDVVVVCGDHIMDIDIDRLMRFHRERQALMTIGLIKVDDVSQYGVAKLGDNNLIEGFVEKPAPGQEPSKLANIGVYVLSPRIRDVFKKMEQDKSANIADFGYDVIPYLTGKGYSVYGYVTERYWNDVGTPERYLQTTMDLLHHRLEHIRLGRGRYGSGKQRIHETTMSRIKNKMESNEVDIEGYVMIGGDCEIGRGVKIVDSCIGDNCIIEDGVTIKGSVVMNFTNICSGSYLNKCIVGMHSNIGRNCLIDGDIEIDSKLATGKVPIIGENVILFNGSVIGPGKRVAPITKSHCVLSTGKFIELGMDTQNLYFINK